jgi:hypothetical protein
MPKVRFTQSNVFSYLLLLLLASLLNFNRLNDPLSGDELYYARLSQIFSLELITGIKAIIPNSILNLSSSNVLHIISFSTICALVLVFRLSLRIKSERVFVALSVLFLLATRQIVQEFNANSALLSPLQVFGTL